MANHVQNQRHFVLATIIPVMFVRYDNRHVVRTEIVEYLVIRDVVSQKEFRFKITNRRISLNQKLTAHCIKFKSAGHMNCSCILNVTFVGQSLENLHYREVVCEIVGGIHLTPDCLFDIGTTFGGGHVFSFFFFYFSRC